MKKMLASLAAVSALGLIAPQAQAGGIPVIDPSNIAQTVKMVENGLKQVQQAKAQVE